MNQLVESKPATPTATFRDQFHKMSGEIGAALPPHIPVERFMRVVMTAVNSSPTLLSADRRSLMQAAMKAAQDGLLPDGRDGALVLFGGQVQWMPMISGVLRKIRNSGELISISAYVAYENDEFVYELGDDEKIIHKPALTDRGKPRLVYAIAKTKDGGIYREIMTVSEVEKVRAVSRAGKSGPWVQWWDEMARKTVLRRLAKRLPMSTDLDDLIRRDDDLYDFKGAQAGAGDAMARLFKPIANPLSDDEPVKQIDVEIDEATSQETDAAEAAPAEAAGDEGLASSPAVDADPVNWREIGAKAFQDGMSRRAVPPEARSDKASADEWLAGFDEAKGSAQ